MDNFLLIISGIPWDKIALVFTAFISFIFALIQLRDKKAMRVLDERTATIDALKAKNDLLERLLNEERREVSEKTETLRRHGDEIAHLKEAASADAGMRTADAAVIQGLHDKISELEQDRIEHPLLISWDGVYKEAFPKDPDNPRWYCAKCWGDRRIHSQLKKVPRLHYRFGECLNEECPNYLVVQ